MMSLLPLVLLLQAAAPDDPDTIVVVGTPAAVRAAWEGCRKGGCTPRRDIAASLGYAEVLFRTGDYRQARELLQGAIARTKGAAAAEPVAVAALYEGTATVAMHDGEQDVTRLATAARVRVLRDRFAADDPRVLQAQLDTADIKLHWHQDEEAAHEYRTIGRLAAAAHLPSLQAAALFREAVVTFNDGRAQAATRLLEGLAADQGQAAVNRFAARVLLARFARLRGDSHATDALIASFVNAGATPAAPTLLWEPRLSTVPAFDGLRWADIGFFVTSDGRVRDPEILRGSPSAGWSKPILAMIGARRYGPLGTPGEQRYQIERWTLTADYVVPTGSFVRQRAGDAHYVRQPLTVVPGTGKPAPALPSAPAHGPAD